MNHGIREECQFILFYFTLFLLIEILLLDKASFIKFVRGFMTWTYLILYFPTIFITIMWACSSFF
jgi:hypothetical protein